MLLNRNRIGAIALGALLAVGTAAALAGVFGADSLADFLGTSGRTQLQSIGDIAASPGSPCFELAVFGRKVTVGSEVRIAGTIQYKAWRGGGSQNSIARVLYDVKDPESGNWTNVLDVTAPDPGISNPGAGLYNTFSKTYNHANLNNGIYYRLTVVSDLATGASQVWGGGFYDPPEE